MTSLALLVGECCLDGGKGKRKVLHWYTVTETDWIIDFDMHFMQVNYTSALKMLPGIFAHN